MSAYQYVVRHTVKDAVIGLAEIIGFGLAFGMCLLAHRTAEAFFGTIGSKVGWIPWVGKTIKADIDKIAQKINSYFAEKEKFYSGKVIKGLHALMGIVNDLGKAVEEIAWGLYLLGEATVKKIPAAVLGRRISQVEAKVLKLQKAPPVPVTIPKNTKAKGLAGKLAGLAAAVAVLRHTVTVTLPHSIGTIKPRVKSLEHWRTKVNKRLRRLEKKAAGVLTVAALFTVLTKAGLNWIRCPKLKKYGPKFCATPDDWAVGLLESALLLTGALTLADMAEDLQKIVKPTALGLANLVTEVRDELPNLVK